MLKQISYPTGGKVSFDWEFHDYSKRSALLQQSSMTDGYFAGHEVAVTGEAPTVQEIKRELKRNAAATTIEIYDNNKPVVINLEDYYPKPGTHIHDDCSLDGVTFCRCIWGWDGNEAYYPNDIPYLLITGPGNYSKKIDIIKRNVWRKHEVVLGVKGSYRFELVNAGRELIQNSICFDFYTNVMTSGVYEKVGISLTNVSYPEGHKDFRENTFIAGGVRIKEIMFDGGDKRIRKLYNYSLDPYDLKSPSSGVLTKAPRYGSFSSIAPAPYSCDNFIMTEWFNHNYVLFVNALPKSTEAAGHIEYSHVTEFMTSETGSVTNNKLDTLAGNRITMYEFVTSAADYDTSDINETLNSRHVPNNQLILTSRHFNRGHLIQKKEYTSEEKTTTYTYEIQEKKGVDFIPATIFPIRDFSTTHDKYISTVCNDIMSWYKDYGIVRYRIIPYNKRLTEVKESGTISDRTRKLFYTPGYTDSKFANSPVCETTVNSKRETIQNYYTYTELNKIHTCVSVCNGYVIAAYRREYDASGNLTAKYIAEIAPYSNLSANSYNPGNVNITSADHPIILLTSKCIETRVYEKNRLCEITDHLSNISTVYIWGYNGEYPVAEIINCTLEKRNQLLSTAQLTTLFQSVNPADFAIINNLRSQLPQSMLSTFTYEMKIGLSSVTDPRGITTYYNYDNFGRLQECYIIENNQKKIVQKSEYHLNISETSPTPPKEGH